MVSGIDGKGGREVEPGGVTNSTYYCADREDG